MPEVFTNETSPLYDPIREPSHALPKVTDLGLLWKAVSNSLRSNKEVRKVKFAPRGICSYPLCHWIHIEMCKRGDGTVYLGGAHAHPKK